MTASAGGETFVGGRQDDPSKSFVCPKVAKMAKMANIIGHLARAVADAETRLVVRTNMHLVARMSAPMTRRNVIRT